MREAVLVTLVGAPLVATVLALRSGLRLQQFRLCTPRLDSATQLLEFKRLVKQQMVVSLVVTALLLAPLLAFVVGLPAEAVSVDDVVFMMPGLALCALVSLLFNLLVERRVRALPTADGQQAEFLRVCQVWRRRALPDW